MKLEDLGYNKELENYKLENELTSYTIGRVCAEHKERYQVKTSDKEYEAEILGNLRFTARSRSDFPAVGDWVALLPYDSNQAIIHAIFPRKSSIERQAVGKKGDVQIIATNIDYAFIVQAVDRDFSINRIERYLAICNQANVNPFIVLNKTDLVAEADLDNLTQEVKRRIKDIPLFTISNLTGKGIEQLKNVLERGKTYCLLGSSGVGKSTLLNTLMGEQVMETKSISTTSNRGRHVTTHRELRIIDNGAVLIDNPGMREIGMADTESGLASTFDFIYQLAENCKYSDCSHTSEKGCAVIEAVDNGALDQASYENYMKLEREKTHYESTVVERRRKDKNFGKMVKDFKKIKKRNKGE